MKRLLACCLIVFWVGCGSQSSDDKETAQSNSGEGELKIVQQTESDSAKDSGDSFADSLIHLTARANELESQEQFNQAAGVWSEIVTRLQSEYGPESWQPANAVLACETAKIQAGFSSAQLEALRNVADLQKQMQAAAGQNEFSIAARLCEQSLRASIELFGVDSPVTSKQRLQLAKLQQQLGQDNEAVFNYEKAASILSARFATVHPELCLIHDNLGEIYLNASNFPGAISHLSSATKMASSIWGDESTEYAKRANQLGVAYHQGGQPEVALQVLRAAEVIRRHKLGPNDPQVGHSLLNTGTVLLDLRRYDEAIEQLVRATEIFSSSQTRLPISEAVAEKLATAYMLASKPELAEPVLAGMLTRAKQRSPQSPIEMADLQYRYAIALGRQGKYDLAEPVLLEAMATQEANLGPTHSKTANSIRAYALLLKQTKRPELADQVLSRIRVAQNPNNNSFPVRIP